jgi:hypothetical protein
MWKALTYAANVKHHFIDLMINSIPVVVGLHSTILLAIRYSSFLMRMEDVLRSYAEIVVGTWVMFSEVSDSLQKTRDIV